MPWTFPDAGEGDNILQSQVFQEDLEVFVEGLNGLNCVLSGCAVTGGADMTPEVAKGAVLSNGTLFAVAAATVTIGTADATNPRLDLVVVNSSGALAVRAGTAAVAPKPPARTANDVVLAIVYVPANDTAIATTQISDRRAMRMNGPIVIGRSGQVTRNTDNTAYTYYSITLPSGLFLTGRKLRVSCGGNFLMNSGTPTQTLTIAFGGTTMFADATAVFSADVDRAAWRLEFTLSATSGAAQTVSGAFCSMATGPKTAATTGIGEIALKSDIKAAFRGTAAVDCDTADRTLTVQFTMSVSNASVETVMDFAVAELL